MIAFTKESIEKAINQLAQFPELLKGRESTDYDLILENGKLYPPILVLSEAHKTLGGEPLTLKDFDNNTKKPFKILRDLGYTVLPKKETSQKAAQQFEVKAFISACNNSNLVISDLLVNRFISSLITKPFVILTGLSGSGKTKLALAFSKWITSKFSTGLTNSFELGEELSSSRVKYVVTKNDKTAVTFIQSETGTKATLPYELINEWIQSIQENKFEAETSARKIREAVELTTKYSPQLNSFETHLKAAAFHLINKGTNTTSENSAVCLLPVGADWTNREPLLGYPNALISDTYVIPENGALQLIIDANNNPDRPFFLILDEMNLSHVERYFADFLSGMESKEPIFLHSGVDEYDGVPPSVLLPDNLFIIGTVNIDETTYMFSPKVLDRANVIEFRVDESDMKIFLAGNTILELDKLVGKGISMASSFLEMCRSTYNEADKGEQIKADLLLFFNELKVVSAEFGYRTAAEILRFSSVAAKVNSEWKNGQILDAAIMQKLLPKLHGSRRKLEATLKALAELCLHEKSLVADALNPKKQIDFSDKAKVKFPISLEKLRRMNIALVNNNFTSYAEA